jgi:phosphate/sulfate permease
VLGLFTGLLAGVVALLAGAMTLRRPPGNRDLVLASLAAVASFAVLGKVLSPQFLIWVAPLTALAASWRMYPLAATLVAAQILTLIEYPSLYDNLEHNEHAATLVVGLRNVLLAAAVALALRALVLTPARGSARSRWLCRLPRPRPAPR